MSTFCRVLCITKKHKLCTKYNLLWWKKLFNSLHTWTFREKKTVDLDEKLKILHENRAYDKLIVKHKYILALDFDVKTYVKRERQTPIHMLYLYKFPGANERALRIGKVSKNWWHAKRLAAKSEPRQFTVSSIQYCKYYCLTPSSDCWRAIIKSTIQMAMRMWRQNWHSIYYSMDFDTTMNR